MATTPYPGNASIPVTEGQPAAPSAPSADARERYLAQSTDHADYENRVRAWEAHEARLRSLPLVL